MQLWAWAKDLLAEHTLLAIAIVLFVEELGIPLLLPGDLLMLLAGIEIARGRASLTEVLAVELAVSTVGATVLFLVSRRLGRPMLLRYGRYFGLDPLRVEHAEARLTRYQFRAVVLGRLTPGLRIFVVMAAGLANLELRRFLPAVAVGGGLYLLGYTLLGMVAGEAAIALIDRLSIPASASLSLLALGALTLGLRAARRSPQLGRPVEDSVVSDGVVGLIAATAGLLASNVVNGAVVVWARFARHVEAAPLVEGRIVGLLLTWPGFLLVALVLALAGPRLGLRSAPRGVRMLMYAVLPFLLTMLVIDPNVSNGDLGCPS
ncbi:MAG: VTT domain-containing protein, partial [Chloroflexota bacterium]